MHATLLPARAAAPVAVTAADGRSGDDPVIAALSRAEQRRDCGDLADAYGWAAYAHQLRQHRRPLPSPALRLRIAQVVAPLALRVGDTTLAAAVHDDLAALTAAADHEQALQRLGGARHRPPRPRRVRVGAARDGHRPR
jgi:hypothetical protein